VVDWSAAYVFHSTTVTTVHVECRCTPSNRHSAVWKHHPRIAAAALVTCSTTDPVYVGESRF